MSSPCRVSWCPPPPEQSIHFDQHQWQQNRGLTGSRLAWRDLDRMHIQRVGAVKPGRKRPTPLWALRDDLTRQVVLAYLEARLFIADHSGSLEKRLARCRAKSLSMLPAKRARLQKWITAYRKLADSPATDPATLRQYEREIQNLDTEIAITPKLPEVVTSVVYFYHRLCFNSPTCGEGLSIAAPHVRQLLFRMDKVAQRIWPEAPRVTKLSSG
jgi:hypothetical protein